MSSSNAHGCTGHTFTTDPGELRVSYAFQPIVDVQERRVISYEALIRGSNGEPAGQVLSSVPDAHLHQFDTRSRVIAIEQVMGFGLQCDLNLNLMPQSLLEPGAAPIGITLDAAKRWGLPASRIVIEITEGELIHDLVRFSEIINAYRASGVKLAIDDFGAGYSGLNLLAVFQPDQLKIDMALVRGIASNGPKQAIVRAIASVCLDLGIDLIAEGIETLEEFCWLTSAGLRYFQGYLFAKPGFATLPTPTYPDPFAPK